MTRRNLAITAAILLSLSLTTTQVEAIQSHPLRWGVTEGEEFVYALQRRVVDSSWEAYMATALPFVTNLTEGQLVTVSVARLETVPEVIDQTIPLAFCDFVRNADSAVILTDYQLMAVPIDDWDLLTTHGGYEHMPGVTVVDTDSEWGTITSGVFEAGGATVSLYQELKYEKTNGTMNYLRLRYSAYGNDLVDIVFVQWHEGMPTVLPAELQMTTVLMLAIAAVAGIALGIAVYKHLKSRKSLVRMLGE